jgi:hypothetical protein
MTRRSGAVLVPIAVAIVSVIVLAWYDVGVLIELRRHVSATFDTRPYAIGTSVGFLLVAGASLLCAAVGWRARTLPLGVAYAIGGGFFTFQSPVLWGFGVGLHGQSGASLDGALPGPGQLGYDSSIIHGAVMAAMVVRMRRAGRSPDGG